MNTKKKRYSFSFCIHFHEFRFMNFFHSNSVVSFELKPTSLFPRHAPEGSSVLTACQKAANKLISIFKSPIDSKYLALFHIDFCISGGISVDASFRKPSLVGSFNLPAP